MKSPIMFGAALAVAPEPASGAPLEIEEVSIDGADGVAIDGGAFPGVGAGVIGEGVGDGLLGDGRGVGLPGEGIGIGEGEIGPGITLPGGMTSGRPGPSQPGETA